MTKKNYTKPEICDLQLPVAGAVCEQGDGFDEWKGMCNTGFGASPGVCSNGTEPGQTGLCFTGAGDDGSNLCVAGIGVK